MHNKYKNTAKKILKNGENGGKWKKNRKSKRMRKEIGQKKIMKQCDYQPNL